MTINKETICIAAGCLIAMAIVGAVRQGQRKKELRNREILEDTIRTAALKETIRTAIDEQNNVAEETVEADKEDSKK